LGEGVADFGAVEEGLAEVGLAFEGLVVGFEGGAVVAGGFLVDALEVEVVGAVEGGGLGGVG